MIRREPKKFVLDAKELFDRPLPYQPEAEAAVIGCIILDPAKLPVINRLIGPDDFYHEYLSCVYRVANEVYGQTGHLDLVVLIAQLRRLGVVTKLADDYDYENDPAVAGLMEIARTTPSAAGAEYYAKVVRDTSLLRKVIDLGGEMVYKALHKGTTETASDVMAQLVSKLSDIAHMRGRDPTTLQAAEAKVMEDLAAGRRAMLQTGVPFFDSIADGCPLSGVWTIFGYPAGGKTTFAITAALNIALGVADQAAVPVRVCSFEQGPTRIAATLLSSWAKVPVHRMINKGEPLTMDMAADLEEARRVHAAADFAMFEENLTPPEIYNECAALAMSKPYGVLVLDYIQDVPPWGDFQEATPRISEAMRILARVARELGWLVIVVSQLDKSAGKANRRPVLTDGLGSSAIEQRSDMISYVWRPHQREIAPTLSGDAAILAWRARFGRVEAGIIKNKYGGVGDNSAMFDGNVMRFRSPWPEERKLWPPLEGEK